MITVEQHGSVTVIRMARAFFGRPLYWTAAYLVDGLLIDTGPLCTASELVRVLDDYDGPSVGIHAVYASSRHLTDKVRTLIDFLATEIHDPPAWDAGIFDR